MQKMSYLPLMPQIIAAFTKQEKSFSLSLMPRVEAAFTKQQKVFSLPLMPRLAVTFASHGKSNQKRFGGASAKPLGASDCTATTNLTKNAS
jgi:hypothetical protein